VRLSRPCSLEVALSAALDHAIGDYVVAEAASVQQRAVRLLTYPDPALNAAQHERF